MDAGQSDGLVDIQIGVRNGSLQTSVALNLYIGGKPKLIFQDSILCTF